MSFFSSTIAVIIFFPFRLVCRDFTSFCVTCVDSWIWLFLDSTISLKIENELIFRLTQWHVQYVTVWSKTREAPNFFQKNECAPENAKSRSVGNYFFCKEFFKLMSKNFWIPKTEAAKNTACDIFSWLQPITRFIFCYRCYWYFFSSKLLKGLKKSMQRVLELVICM